MCAVVDIAQDAPLVVNLASVWIVPYCSLQEVENDGWFLLEEVDGTARD